MIFVTGGLGFIGHNVVRQLEKRNHEVRIIDNCTDYTFIPKDELAYLIKERKREINSILHNFHIADKQLHMVFNMLKPHTVIHLASMPRSKIVNKNPTLGAYTMIEGLLNLLELCKNHSVKRFVYVSSSMVYGDWNGCIDESHPTNPKDIYGTLKLTGEKLVKLWAEQNNHEYTILRPSAVYGPLDVEDRVLSKFLLNAMRGQDIMVEGENEVLDFSYVEDVAWGITSAALSKNTVNKTYNITRNQPSQITLHDAAKLAVEIVGKGNITIHPKNIAYPSRGKLNSELAKQDFGYNPYVDLEIGLECYHKWLADSTYWQSKIK
jgi:nucleoside-diphosphate-sugar epimerase